MSREIMQQALDAIKQHFLHHEHGCVYLNPVMYALEQELAKPEQEKQEPVARFNWNEAKFEWLTEYSFDKHHMKPLYLAPPRKPWQGLTDDEIKEILGLNEAPWSLSGVALQHVMDDVRALEAKIKEKNT
jgi:hypothetical protein